MLMGPVAMGQPGAVSFNPLNGTTRDAGHSVPTFAYGDDGASRATWP